MAKLTGEITMNVVMPKEYDSLRKKNSKINRDFTLSYLKLGVIGVSFIAVSLTLVFQLINYFRWHQ